MNKTFTVTALVLATGLSTAATAEAKDPYNAISDFVGRKNISAKLDAQKGKKPQKWKSRLEVQHYGMDEVVAIYKDGTRAVHSSAYGATDFAWEGDRGYIYAIEHYPMDNDHEPVWGSILEGDRRVGSFRLDAAKARAPKASGRWVGELAFPGGAGVELSLQVASMGQRVSDTCVSYDTRVNFFGHNYEDTSLTTCKGSGGSYGAGFFYFDERNNDRYFVSIQVEPTKDAEWLQGQVFLIPLTEEGSFAEGKILTSRPPVLGL